MAVELKDVITVAASVVSSIGAGAWVSAVVTGRMAKHREDVSAQRNYLTAKLAKLEVFYPEAMAALMAFSNTSLLDAEAQERITLNYNKIVLLGSDDVQSQFNDAVAAIQLKSDNVDERVRQRSAVVRAMKEHLRTLEKSLAAINTVR